MKTQTRGLAVVENAVDIARSPEDVFDYCVDLTREPEWNPKARRVEQVTAGPIGLGTRYEAEFLKGNTTTIEFVRFEHPVAWASVGRSRRLDAKAEGRVSATEDGAHLVMRMESRPKGTLRVLLPIMGRFMHKQQERNLAAIKEALEALGASAVRRVIASRGRRSQMLRIKEAASEFLANKRVAVTGVSREAKGHGSNVVYKRLRDRGYEVFAVNPNADEVEGDRCYHDLRSIPGGVDAVVVGTRPEIADETMRECAELGITRVWMHRGPGAGSVSEAATAYGREHGINVIDGGCPCMFDPAADLGHKAMRIVFTLNGHVPREV